MSREPRIDRKSIRRPDTFVKKGSEALGLLLARKNTTAVVIGIVIVGVLGYYAYDWWASRRLERDWVAFYQADEAKPDEKPAKWKEVYEKGGNTRAAFMAAVSLADHYYDAAERKQTVAKVKQVTGKPPKAPPKPPKDSKTEVDDPKKDTEPSLTAEQASAAAVEWYGKALGFSRLLPAERELLTIDWGNALEQQGKWDEALAKYDSVAQGVGAVKPLGLLHSGRMYEVKKNKEAAKNAYQSISSEFPNTEYARIAKNYLRRMESPLFPTEKP